MKQKSIGTPQYLFISHLQQRQDSKKGCPAGPQHQKLFHGSIRAMRWTTHRPATIEASEKPRSPCPADVWKRGATISGETHWMERRRPRGERPTIQAVNRPCAVNDFT